MKENKKIEFYTLTHKELTDYLVNEGYRSFRADQLFLEVYKRYVLDFRKMTEISKKDRKIFDETFSLRLPEITNKAVDQETGTTKFTIRLEDGEVIETVLIYATDGRVTQCVSSEVGCRLNCQFCATARLDYKRSLTTAEYVSQIMLICSLIETRPTNLVFMGMGEPLMNTEALTKAVKVITEDRGLDFGFRKITISTAGIIPEIERVLREFPNIGIAISLNSTINEKRNKLMPINKKYPVNELFEFLSEKKKLFKRRPTLEYVLIKDVNDSQEEAENLVRLTENIPCKINLIPFNEFPGCDFKRPDKETINRFLKTLMKGSNAVTFRESAGGDIFAACGQLACFNKSPES